MRKLNSAPELLRSITSPDPMIVAALLVLPAANLLCTSGSIWSATRRFGRVGFFEMVGLIGSASLLNYLPMRAGLIGRLAYHKKINTIDVARAGAATLIQLVFSGVGLVVALVAAMLPHEAVGIVLGGLSTLLLVSACGLSWKTTQRNTQTLSLSASLVLTALWRTLDMLVWVVRYALALKLVGMDATWLAAVALATVSQVGMLLSIVGNGLGVREWLVGLTTKGLAGNVGRTSTSNSDPLAVGLLTDLVNRVAELVFIVPVGIMCSFWVARRVRSHTATHE
ncbi:MAG: hypothetical protein H6815_08610 [Phycisphaeraceae bacterium]|nr:hypothetical protein [Phycisphaerales bacterium]MCB9860503.1 hypothetical protein [Phycisphaeraceae bacterium]